jgi:hypothetical protein
LDLEAQVAELAGLMATEQAELDSLLLTGGA